MRIRIVKPSGAISAIGKSASFGMLYGQSAKELSRKFRVGVGLLVGDAVRYHDNYGVIKRMIGLSYYYVEFIHPRVWYADCPGSWLTKVDGGLLAIVAISSEDTRDRASQAD